MLKRNSRKHKYNIAVLHSMYKTNFIFFLSLFFYFSNNNKKNNCKRKQNWNDRKHVIV